MPFTLHTPTNHPHPISWNLITPKQPIPTSQNLIFTRLKAFSSLRTSLDCVSSDGGGVEKISQQIRLPFVVKSPNKVTRFFWNGGCMELVTVDGVAASGDNDGLLKVFGSVVRDFFIPREVNENYVEFVKWKLLHRVFSSALQVLATQVLCRFLIFVCLEASLFRIDLCYVWINSFLSALWYNYKHLLFKCLCISYVYNKRL